MVGNSLIILLIHWMWSKFVSFVDELNDENDDSSDDGYDSRDTGVTSTDELRMVRAELDK